MGNFSFKRIRKIIKSDLLLNGKQTFLYIPLSIAGIVLIILILTEVKFSAFFIFYLYMCSLLMGLSAIAKNINKQIFEPKGISSLLIPATVNEKYVAYFIELLILMIWITLIFHLLIIFWNIIWAEEIKTVLSNEYFSKMQTGYFYVLGNTWLIPQLLKTGHLFYNYIFPAGLICGALLIYNALNFSKIYGLIFVTEFFGFFYILMNVLHINLTKYEFITDGNFDSVTLVTTHASKTLISFWNHTLSVYLWIGVLLMLYVIYRTFQNKELR